MKYPFAALAELMGLSENQAGIALSVSGRVLQEYRTEGMSEKVADHLACKAGFHPSVVWPDWLDNQIAATSQPCRQCGRLFVPTRKGHNFCTRKCRAASPGALAAARRRYHANVEAKERKLASATRYARRYAEYLNAQRRARYAANAEYERAARRERWWRQKAAS